MLKIERDERTITVVSDDHNAENAMLGEALDATAPHLLDGFNEAPFEDGELRFNVDAEDWPSLLEALEAIDAEYPGVATEATSSVEEAVRELNAAT